MSRSMPRADAFDPSSDVCGNPPAQTPIDAALFRLVFKQHPARATILTADDGTGPCAMTVTSLISLSADPAMVGFSLSRSSSSTQKILKAGRVAIHFLDAAHVALARLCATPGADRFQDTGLWSRLPDGTPRFHGVGSWFSAEIERTLELEGATFAAARLIEGALEGDAPALLYASGRWRGLGNEIE